MCLHLDSQAQLQQAYNIVLPTEGQFSLQSPYQLARTEDSAPTDTAPVGRKRKRAQVSAGEAVSDGASNGSDHGHSTRPVGLGKRDPERDLERDLDRHAVFLPALSAAASRLALQERPCSSVGHEQHQQRSVPPQAQQLNSTIGFSQAGLQLGSTQEALSPPAQDYVALGALAAVVKPKFRFASAPWLPQAPDVQPPTSCNLFNTLISNVAEVEQLAEAHVEAVLIPARCSFMLGDITRIKRLTAGKNPSSTWKPHEQHFSL